MASPFSWSDTIQVTLGSCLPCIKSIARAEDSGDDEPQHHNPAINRIPRARPDELQGLLADPDTDPEAETMSLHSNPGRSAGKRSKKRRSKKSANNSRKITLFGYNLFGSGSSQPIQLPDDDDDALYPEGRGRRVRNGSLSAPSIGTAHSTASTFDLDAAPLDTDTINALSSPSAAEAAAQASAAAEAQRLQEKEERRRRRREKKELKRLAETLAAQGVNEDGDEFEGFQGSGAGMPPVRKSSGYPRIPNTMYPSGPASDSGSGSGFSGSARDGFGKFVSAPNGAPLISSQNEDDDEAADLDGGLYSRNQTRNAQSGGGGSDSRSRTSASASDRPHNPRDVLAHLRSRSRSQSYSQASSSRVNSPLQSQFQSTPETPSPSDLNPTAKKSRKVKTSSSSRTTQSRSSATTSQSQSPLIPSPVSPSFAKEIVSPSTVEQGQGFFDLEDDVPSPSPLRVEDMSKTASAFPSTRIGGGGGEGGGFPITGFGSGAAGQRRAKDFGAFLATRGDDDEASVGL